MSRISPQKRSRMYARILHGLVWLCAALTAGVLLYLLIYILVQGVPNLSLDLLIGEYSTDNPSMLPAFINTLIVIALSLLLAVPTGIGSAIYLVEYAKRGNKLVPIIRVTTETLAGIPSIVYGLFGYLLFNVALGWSYSLMSGILTMVIMILPLIIRTTEEALLAVPDSYREGSLGLGCGHLRTIFRIVLPSAIPGILSGVILGVGRIVGETAALIYTAGTVAGVPDSLMGSGRTLAIHMYTFLSEMPNMEAAYATAVVLIVLVLVINALSSWAARKMERR